MVKKKEIMEKYEFALEQGVAPQKAADIHKSCMAGDATPTNLDEYDQCASPKLKKAVQDAKRK